MKSDEREAALVEAFLSTGSEEAFAELFTAFYPQVFRYFSFRGFAREAAEEMTQDVMVAVYRKGSTVHQREHFRTWLFKVAQNTLRQQLRKTRNEPVARPLEDREAREKQALLVGGEERGFLDLIQGLPEEERQLLMLRYLDGLSYEEIAGVLNLPLGTVKWKLFDSKSRIRSNYAALFEG